MAEFPAPAEGIVLTHFIVASGVGRACRFYADVLGGEVLRDGEPSIVALANSWSSSNVTVSRSGSSRISARLGDDRGFGHCGGPAGASRS